MMDTPVFWDQVLMRLSQAISCFQYDAWFRPIKPEQADENTLYLVVEDPFVRSVLKQRYSRMIENAVEECAGRKMQVLFPDPETPAAPDPQPKEASGGEVPPIWKQAAAMLSEKLTPEQACAWILPVTAVQKSENSLQLIAPDRFVANILEVRYLRMIEDAVQLAAGRRIEVSVCAG
ncbi:MAG: hypothetical protein IJE08_10250 [Clostridia bacterium]|nr:hypothetical protein [Clostridia bacterium]